jgi:hypothetical protein
MDNAGQIVDHWSLDHDEAGLDQAIGLADYLRTDGHRLHQLTPPGRRHPEPAGPVAAT